MTNTTKPSDKAMQVARYVNPMLEDVGPDSPMKKAAQLIQAYADAQCAPLAWALQSVSQPLNMFQIGVDSMEPIDINGNTWWATEPEIAPRLAVAREALAAYNKARGV